MFAHHVVSMLTVPGPSYVRYGLQLTMTILISGDRVSLGKTGIVLSSVVI